MLSMNRNELADFLNVARPSLSREMCRMRTRDDRFPQVVGEDQGYGGTEGCCTGAGLNRGAVRGQADGSRLQT